MKNKNMKKKVAAAVCLSLLSVATVPDMVMANAPELIQPYAEYISDYSISLFITNSGEATVKVDLFPKASATSTSIRATLQKKTTNGWDDIKTWSVKKQGGYTSISESYSVSKGTYRVTATIKADTETVNVSSASKTY